MNNKEKKRLGALDALIIIVLVICIVSIGLRVFSTMRSETNANVQLDNYIISFKVSNIKDSSAKNYFEAGTNFYLSDSGVLLGSLREGVIVKDAETYYETEDGKVVLITNNAVGDLYRVDVEASLEAQGRVDANGAFYLGGNIFIAPNKEIMIYSKYLSITVVITDIQKA